MVLEVYIDGNCEPTNPGGTASYGLVIYRGKARLLAKSAIVDTGDKMSNNVAEYAGLIAFFEWADNQPAEETVIKSDSQLLINQMRGEWQARQGLYLPYYRKAMAYLINHTQLAGRKLYQFKWIPREENWEADRLSRDILFAHGVGGRE